MRYDDRSKGSESGADLPLNQSKEMLELNNYPVTGEAIIIY